VIEGAETLAATAPGPPATSRTFWPVLVGLAAFGVASGLFLWGNHARPVLQIQIAFSPKACCSWQVWINGIRGDLTIPPMRSGTDSVYTIPVYRAHINELFVTVGTQPGGNAQVRRIWLTRGSHTVSQVTSAELQHAVIYQAESRPRGGGLELSGTGSQPALDAAVSLDSHESSFRLFLGRAISQRLIAFAGLIVAGTLFVATLTFERRGRWFVGAALASTVVGVSILPWLSRRFQFHDNVSQAVGYASYVGVWKSRERFIVDLALVLSVLTATTVGVAARRFRAGVSAAPTTVEATHGLRRSIAGLLVALPVAVIALSSAPNLRLYVGAAPQHVPAWDANNFVFWQYLVQTTKLEPVKDFFWLYGFQWGFDEAPPWGLLVSYGWFLTFWTFLAVGSYLSLARFFSGRSLVVRYVMLCGLWLTAFLTSDMPFATRYVGPLSVVLLFAGIDSSRDRWWSWQRIVFAVALFDLTMFEVAQAGYALVPIAFLAVAEFLITVARNRGMWMKWLLPTLATVAVPLGAAALVYAATGVASQTASLYRALTFASSAYAFPSAVDQWVSHPTNLEGVIFWSVPLTLTIGLTGLFVRRDRLRLSYAVVTALGLLGFMIMQKQILRPHTATQIWLPMIFGLAYWAVSDTLLSASRRWSAVLAVAGTAAALVLVSGGYRQGWDVLAGGPERVQGSIHALVHDRPAFARQSHEQFTPSTFANFSEELPVVHALQSVPAVKGGGPVWILGDDSSITMILGRSWPYYFNDMYDASPIVFQKKILRRLAQHPPARVVWNFATHAMIFDAVPMPVRVPLLYEWSVQHLIPARRVGTFEILRPRAAHEPVDLSWWRRHIGIRVDLGHIPAVANLPHKTCATGASCSSYIVVELPRGTPHEPQIVIHITVRGLPFEVAFEPGSESKYVIPLDRVWFWAATTGERKVDTTTTSGARITVVQRVADPNVLY
jgi:hypothetical protein